MTNTEFLNRYLTDRRNTGCLKWDSLEDVFGEKDLLPMWIADTEFKTCDEIRQALHQKIDHGIFGYARLPEGYIEAYSGWMQRHHGTSIEKEWVQFVPGCVTAIAWLIKAFTKEGDAGLLLTPVYYPFHSVIKDTGRKLVTVDMRYDKGRFSIDFDAFERAIVDNHIKFYIHCSPHNPVARVWTEEELDRLFNICRKHGVFVISDEIHQDIIFPGHKFIPSLFVQNGAYRDMVVTVTSVSKTFNLPGLIHSHILIADENLRQTYQTFSRGNNRTSMNLLGLTAAQAGYTYADEWYAALLNVIQDNYQRMCAQLEQYAPDIYVTPLEGTFLPMLDLRNVLSPDEVKDFMVHKCHLAVDYGEQFGENFKGFIRLNIATDPKFVDMSINNILKALGRT